MFLVLFTYSSCTGETLGPHTILQMAKHPKLSLDRWDWQQLIGHVNSQPWAEEYAHCTRPVMLHLGPGVWDANVAVTRGWVTSTSPKRMRLACLTSSQAGREAGYRTACCSCSSWWGNKLRTRPLPWWGAYVVSIEKLMVWPWVFGSFKAVREASMYVSLISGHPPSFPKSLPWMKYQSQNR